MRELPKVFDHSTVDPKWYAYWEKLGAFRADPKSGRPPFSMVLPPPNVTGWLHIGHALNQTIPDVLARWKRMCGFDVLWLPGTDHAGIATQNVVEKQLAKEGKSRHDLGREAFEERVWSWVETSHSTITSQMRKLGSSVDWSRERFTLDDDLSRAVRRVFVSLYNEGRIYRGTYLVSWCPRCRTALSDLEVVHKSTNGSLYYLRYPHSEGQGHVLVATTRPETMLGDTAVAVHPDDERYSGLIGKTVRLPLVGRDIPVIADSFVDQEFGTGAVKVTPAHDPNDFEMGKRHNLPQVSVIDEDGRMSKDALLYAGQDRFAARKKIIAALEVEGLLDQVQDHEHAVGHCERCGTVVEPLLSKQWFVKIESLADQAVDAVSDGHTRFLPDNWTKTYNEWMTNIHDWCISRQLWWGHRIPAWYCDACGEIVVSESDPDPDTCSCGGRLRQETDVLDTWFSSGLWPFSTLGWPNDTEDLRRYYPTTVLITAHDIIFFWVARMMMLGLWFQQKVPFRSVYITSLVRDEHGQKMSKSKGNVIDPLELMDDIGADAFRFTLAALATPGMDISLSEGRLRAHRQFVNKLWNVSRFVLMNIPDSMVERPQIPEPSTLDVIHRWILHRCSQLAKELDEALTNFRFDVGADRLYHFVWHEYADWYIELIKPELRDEAGPQHLAVLLEIHDRILRMLHPFVPFVTEEIWQALPRQSEEVLSDNSSQTITLARFPKPVEEWNDVSSVVTMELIQEVVTSIRTVRSEWGVAPSQKIAVFVQGASSEVIATLEHSLDHVTRLAGVNSVEFDRNIVRTPDTVRRVVRDFEVHIPLTGIVDREKEKERVSRELEKIIQQRRGFQKRLSNEAFVSRADPEVVRETREKEVEIAQRQKKLELILEEISSS
ncbi:MAG: valine--tRNA ligase [Vicinamibacterales bacterium]